MMAPFMYKVEKSLSEVTEEEVVDEDTLDRK